MFHLKNIGKSESSVKTYSHRLTFLAAHVDLDNPEAVKGFVANKKCANSYKNEFVKAYNHYIECNGLSWEKPKHRSERKIPRIPTTEAIKKIITRASPKYATVLTLLLETGAMPYELQSRIKG